MMAAEEPDELSDDPDSQSLAGDANIFHWCSKKWDEEEVSAFFKKFWSGQKDGVPEELLCLDHCIGCIEAYHLDRKTVVESGRSKQPEGVLYSFECSLLSFFLTSLKHRLQIKWQRQKLSEPCKEEDGRQLPIVLQHILKYPFYLFLKDLHNLFVDVLEVFLGQGRPVSVPQMPGLYLLLIHPNNKLQTWAKGALKAFDPIRLEDPSDLLRVVNLILSVLKFDLQSDPVLCNSIGLEEPSRRIIVMSHQFSMTVYWQGIHILLTHMDKALMGTVHGEIPLTILNSLLLEAKSPYPGNNLFLQKLLCFSVLMESFKQEVWFRVAPYKQEDVFIQIIRCKAWPRLIETMGRSPQTPQALSDHLWWINHWAGSLLGDTSRKDFQIRHSAVYVYHVLHNVHHLLRHVSSSGKPCQCPGPARCKFHKDERSSSRMSFVDAEKQFIRAVPNLKNLAKIWVFLEERVSREARRRPVSQSLLIGRAGFLFYESVVNMVFVKMKKSADEALGTPCPGFHSYARTSPSAGSEQPKSTSRNILGATTSGRQRPKIQSTPHHAGGSVGGEPGRGPVSSRKDRGERAIEKEGGNNRSKGSNDRDRRKSPSIGQRGGSSKFSQPKQRLDSNKDSSKVTQKQSHPHPFDPELIESAERRRDHKHNQSHQRSHSGDSRRHAERERTSKGAHSERNRDKNVKHVTKPGEVVADHPRNRSDQSSREFPEPKSSSETSSSGHEGESFFSQGGKKVFSFSELHGMLQTVNKTRKTSTENHRHRNNSGKSDQRESQGSTDASSSHHAVTNLGVKKPGRLRNTVSLDQCGGIHPKDVTRLRLRGCYVPLERITFSEEDGSDDQVRASSSHKKRRRIPSDSSDSSDLESNSNDVQASMRGCDKTNPFAVAELPVEDCDKSNSSVIDEISADDVSYEELPNSHKPMDIPGNDTSQCSQDGDEGLASRNSDGEMEGANQVFLDEVSGVLHQESAGMEGRTSAPAGEKEGSEVGVRDTVSDEAQLATADKSDMTRMKNAASSEWREARSSEEGQQPVEDVNSDDDILEVTLVEPVIETLEISSDEEEEAKTTGQPGKEEFFNAKLTGIIDHTIRSCFEDLLNKQGNAEERSMLAEGKTGSLSKEASNPVPPESQAKVAEEPFATPVTSNAEEVGVPVESRSGQLQHGTAGEQSRNNLNIAAKRQTDSVRQGNVAHAPKPPLEPREEQQEPQSPSVRLETVASGPRPEHKEQEPNTIIVKKRRLGSEGRTKLSDDDATKIIEAQLKACLSKVNSGMRDWANRMSEARGSESASSSTTQKQDTSNKKGKCNTERCRACQGLGGKHDLYNPSQMVPQQGSPDRSVDSQDRNSQLPGEKRKSADDSVELRKRRKMDESSGNGLRKLTGSVGTDTQNDDSSDDDDNCSDNEVFSSEDIEGIERQLLRTDDEGWEIIDEDCEEDDGWEVDDGTDVRKDTDVQKATGTGANDPDLVSSDSDFEDHALREADAVNVVGSGKGGTSRREGGTSHEGEDFLDFLGEEEDQAPIMEEDGNESDGLDLNEIIEHTESMSQNVETAERSSGNPAPRWARMKSVPEKSAKDAATETIYSAEEERSPGKPRTELELEDSLEKSAAKTTSEQKNDSSTKSVMTKQLPGLVVEGESARRADEQDGEIEAGRKNVEIGQDREDRFLLNLLDHANSEEDEDDGSDAGGGWMSGDEADDGRDAARKAKIVSEMDMGRQRETQNGENVKVVRDASIEAKNVSRMDTEKQAGRAAKIVSEIELRKQKETGSGDNGNDGRDARNESKSVPRMDVKKQAGKTAGIVSKMGMKKQTKTGDRDNDQDNGNAGKAAKIVSKMVLEEQAVTVTVSDDGSSEDGGWLTDSKDGDGSGGQNAKDDSGADVTERTIRNEDNGAGASVSYAAEVDNDAKIRDTAGEVIVNDDGWVSDDEDEGGVEDAGDGEYDEEGWECTQEFIPEDKDADVEQERFKVPTGHVGKNSSGEMGKSKGDNLSDDTVKRTRIICSGEVLSGIGSKSFYRINPGKQRTPKMKKTAPSKQSHSFHITPNAQQKRIQKRWLVHKEMSKNAVPLGRQSLVTGQKNKNMLPQEPVNVPVEGAGPGKEGPTEATEGSEEERVVPTVKTSSYRSAMRTKGFIESLKQAEGQKDGNTVNLARIQRMQQPFKLTPRQIKSSGKRLSAVARGLYSTANRPEGFHRGTSKPGRSLSSSSVDTRRVRFNLIPQPSLNSEPPQAAAENDTSAEKNRGSRVSWETSQGMHSTANRPGEFHRETGEPRTDSSSSPVETRRVNSDLTTQPSSSSKLPPAVAQDDSSAEPDMGSKVTSKTPNKSAEPLSTWKTAFINIPDTSAKKGLVPTRGNCDVLTNILNASNQTQKDLRQGRQRPCLKTLPEVAASRAPPANSSSKAHRSHQADKPPSDHTRLNMTKTGSHKDHMRQDTTKTGSHQDRTKTGSHQDRTKTGSHQDPTGQNKTKTGSHKDHTKPDTTKTGSHTDHRRPDETKTGSHEDHTRPDETKTGSHKDHTKPGSAKTGSHKDHTRPDTAKTGSHKNRRRPDETEMGSHKDHTRPDTAKTGPHTDHTRPDETKTGTHKDHTRPDETKTGTHKDHTRPDETKTGSHKDLTKAPSTGSTNTANKSMSLMRTLSVPYSLPSQRPFTSAAEPAPRLPPETFNGLPDTRPGSPEKRPVKMTPTKALTVDQFLGWILGWKINDMNGEITGDLSEVLTRCAFNTIHVVPNHFESIDQYYATFLPLKMIQIWNETRKMYLRVRNEKTPTAALAESALMTYEGEVYKKCCFKVSLPSPVEAIPDIYLRKCDLVLIKPDNTDSFEPILGYVEESMLSAAAGFYSNRKSYDLTIYVRILGDADFKSHCVQLQPLMSLGSHIQQFLAFCMLQKCSVLTPSILSPTRRDVFSMDDQKPLDSSIYREHYTEEQESFIRGAFHCIHESYGVPRICMLQGPPCSGKTRTLTMLVACLLRDSVRNSGPAVTKSKILLCTPNDNSLDVVLSHLWKILRRDKTQENRSNMPAGLPFFVLRLGDVNQVTPTYQLFVLDKLVMDMQVKCDTRIKELKTKIGELELHEQSLDSQIQYNTNRNQDLIASFMKDRLQVRQRRREIEDQLDKEVKWKNEFKQEDARTELLAQADVICCKVNDISSPELQMALRRPPDDPLRVKFSCAIIDEACQCLEVDTILPLYSTITKLVMAGDPHELTHRTIRQVSRRSKLTQSLFTRLWMCFQSSLNQPIQRLTEQHMCHPEIFSFPNKIFYNGKIRNSSNACSKEKDDFVLMPYLIFNLLDGEEMETSNGDFSNEAELQLVQSIMGCINQQKLPKIAIAIVSPYPEQIRLLRQRFSNPAGLYIGNIEGLQGKVKDIVIMSCVRTKAASKNLEFLDNHNKLNVAMTRAKHSLFIVGSFKVLPEINDLWGKLFRDAQERELDINVVQKYTKKLAGNCIKKNFLNYNELIQQKRATDSEPKTATSDT